ncbi:MAG TPA: GMC family oxidoreductase [bacterium]|nr:GMC family oxidoreductase [bacterium]
MNDRHFDIIIIGTGAGGGTLAYALAGTGKKILVLERGDFLIRSKDNWDPAKVFGKEIYHTKEHWLTKDGKTFRPGQAYMVGGQTKVYGAALLRLRREDLGEIQYEDGISPAWPLTYEDLEPYYTEAEKIYFVHGERGEDPTEPPASKPFPYPKLSHESRIEEVHEELRGQGLHPFHLPIAIKRFEDNIKDSPCIRCDTCDGFPCMVNAKGDSEICCVNHALTHPNVTLLTRAKVEKIETDASGRRVTGVSVTRDGQMLVFGADTIISSCGAINSAALLLRSADSKNPKGLANSSGLVGKNYMCHNNSAMLAIHFTKTNPTLFQKTIGVNDFYFGKNGARGHIQLLGKATEGLLKCDQPNAPAFILKYMATHSVDWWFTTEDLPNPENAIEATKDGNIRVNYTPNNRKPHALLIQEFKKVLRKLGFSVLLTKAMPINAVAHQVGTTVFGKDPEKSVLDPWCRAHDHENLYVVDGGFFPSSSGVNPALTIAAQALRVAAHLKQQWGMKSESPQAYVQQ